MEDGSVPEMNERRETKANQHELDVTSAIGLGLFIYLLALFTAEFPVVVTLAPALCSSGQFTGPFIDHSILTGAGSTPAKSTLIITGGAGYVGSHTVAALTKDREIMDAYDLVVLDNLESGHIESVPEGCTFAQVRISVDSSCTCILKASRCKALL